ncbi:hypothetical protein BRSPCE3_10620 [Bradyrhizobium sp. Ce-3]|nr:hypothetical protein BRSPCE3_10620 [Bradyrhizobium sp. Ce-3]
MSSHQIISKRLRTERAPIGQGLTGLSTLSLSSFIAIAGIMLGTGAGLRGALRVRPLATA